MMKLKIASLALYCTLLINANAQQADTIATKSGSIIIQPVQHASLVISSNNKTIYIDPTGGPEAFKGMAPPDIILITDIHGDHHDQKTIDMIIKPHSIVIAPKAVADKITGLPESKLIILKNGAQTSQLGFQIRAIPMYNLPETDSSKHVKGRGNGYILTINGKNIYVSGDTDDIPEMRALKNIDVAFVCMNPPYTMDIHKASDAVLTFKPKIVYPYHYRGKDGLNDVDAFKKSVNKGDSKIEVRLRNWYALK